MHARNALRTWYVVCALATAPSARAAEPKDIVIGESLVMHSEILNEDRTILIGKPASYDQGNATYPVLVVLDGDTHFHYTTGLAQALASNSIIPDMLVVGIPNTVRIRDLTPRAVDPRIGQAEPRHGGAADFRAFLGRELVPWLDESYRTHPYRIIVGHSLGGLFAIDTLLEEPELFDAYIAISPSLQWDEQRLVERTESAFEPGKERNATLFMTAGNEGGPLLGGVRKFAAVLGEKAPERLDWRFEHMPLESHGSVPLPSTYQGLEFVFADWTMRDPLETYERHGIDAIDHFFANADEKYRLERGVPTQIVATLGRELEAAGRLDELTEVLKRYWGTVKPPARFLERIAVGYRERGQQDRAAELYRLALQVEPDSASARQALAELGHKPD